LALCPLGFYFSIAKAVYGARGDQMIFVFSCCSRSVSSWKKISSPPNRRLSASSTTTDAIAISTGITVPALTLPGWFLQEAEAKEYRSKIWQS
jgi:hypothetical protein